MMMIMKSSKINLWFLLIVTTFSFQVTLVVSSSKHDNIFFQESSAGSTTSLSLAEENQVTSSLSSTTPPILSVENAGTNKKTPPPIIWNNDDNGSSNNFNNNNNTPGQEEDCNNSSFFGLPSSVDMKGVLKYVMAGLAVVFMIQFFANCFRNCNQKRDYNKRTQEARQAAVAERRRQRQEEYHHLHQYNIFTTTTTSTSSLSERYEQIVKGFYFQTVLSDNTLSESRRYDEESPKVGLEKKDDACSTSSTTAESVTSSSSSSAEEAEEANNDAAGDWFQSWRQTLSFFPIRRDQHQHTCCICLEEYRQGETICVPITKECNHVFHEECMLTWMLQAKNDDCPLCRTDILKPTTIMDGGDGDGDENYNKEEENTSAR